MFCGFNFGMAAGGFISANLIPAYGWHSLLLLGGVLPIALALVLWIWLPESARYLVVRNSNLERIKKVLSPIAPALIAQVRGFSTPERTGSGQNVLRLLFSNTYRTGTLLLWVTYFMGLVVVFLLTSWLPTLLRESGTSMERAALIGGLFQFGGVLSAVLVGWAMDHFNPHKVRGLFYGLTALLVYIVGQSLGHADLLPWLVLLAGMCINGAQSAMPSLAARFYPTHGRATGVSWMLGIGRFGGILGAWLGATLLGLGWSFEQVLTGLILPASLACAALLIKGLMTHSDADETAYARQS
jgi:AAHS family 4-hydroxybenzoate transporter-like MFS transporter